MPRVRHLLAAPDLGAVAEREHGGFGQAAERHVADQGEDLAFENGEVDDLAELALPLAIACLRPAMVWPRRSSAAALRATRRLARR